MDDHEFSKGKTETLILSKKDEQERVQKKTFTNWINTYLVQAHPPYKIENLYESIKDGLCLIHLLEVMTGEKLRKEQPKNMQKIHRLSNINSALDFLKNRKIKLVNINATDIADGRPSIILGLMWTVILFFQIEEQEEILIGALGSDFDGKVNAKGALLSWVNKTIGEKYDLNVTDFGPSWRDGKAFNALVHNIDPSLINWKDVQKKSNRENLLEAFKQAEELGIPHIIDAQDVDVDKPDEKSIMTYITQFLKSYPDGGKGIEEDIIAINKQKEEAEQRALEEERERLRLEAEEEARKKKLEEEIRRKKEEEEKERKRKEEEERKRKEEERKRKEEEERKRKEEEERKRREEEERKRKEEEERKRKEEEERKRKEEERKRKLAEEEEGREKFNHQLENMEKWVEDLNSFLGDGIDCTDDSITAYLNNLNGLLSDKDLIDEDLSSLKDDVRSGNCGSEYSQPLSKAIQDFEKKLKESISKANGIKNNLTQNQNQLKICEKNMDLVNDWIKNYDKSMDKINDAKTPEKYSILLNEFQSHLYTEPKAQNLLKEAHEMFAKLKGSAPKNLQDSAMIKKMKDLENKLKDKIDNGNAIDKSLKDFDKGLSKANDWQKDYERKMSSIGPLSNDITKLKQQLEKIQNLKKLQSDGDKIIQEAIEKGQAAMHCAEKLDPLQKKINLDLESAENKWSQNNEDLDNLKNEVMGKIAKLEGIMDSGNKVDNWLKAKETDLKVVKAPCDTLPQKLAKIDELEKLLNEVESESQRMEDYFGELKEISDSDPNALKKLNMTKQQLTSLKNSIKDAIQDAHNQVNNQEDFGHKLEEAEEWLEMAKALKLDSMSRESPGSVDELKRRKEIIEKLIESRNNGENLVKLAVSSGEKVARETSSKGKEEILGELRGLNKDLHELFDGLGPAKQALEMKLTKAANISRELESMVNWAEEFERKLENVNDSDIEKIKALCDDAQAKLYLADNLYNQTKSIDDPEFIDHAKQIKGLIKEHFENAQQMHSHIKKNLHLYNDLIKNCKNVENWMNESEKKMNRYGEPSGSKPEELSGNLKSLEKLIEDVKMKRNEIENVHRQGKDLCDSSPSRANEIDSVLDKIDKKYHQLINNLEDKERDLREDIKDQKDFDEATHKAQQWLNDATQQLLKYSDIKQCNPSLIDTFSRNFEKLFESLPYGEESISTAQYIGKKHLAHLKDSKLHSSNNFDRDSKKVNELDRNWNDFKKQIDLVHKNMERVKDNLSEFNNLQSKLEGYIKNKENCLKESNSIDSLKYIVSEIDDAARDLENLQAKAVEVSGSLNYPNASIIAKGVVDRYQNLKRNIESELNKAKQLDNDWAVYKNAVNVAEKWMVDMGFRIMDNDYNAYSPEEAQTKMEEFSKIHDQINNFTLEVEKVNKIGKELASKISENHKSKSDKGLTTKHTESEIETDLGNLQSSHKKLLENANQTKRRINDQLANWRKYRDLVQTNDKYLTKDMNEWWRNKKFSAPETIEEYESSIKEAKGFLKDLVERQSELKMSKSNCQSLLLDKGPKEFSVMAEIDRKKQLSLTTPLSRLSESVEAGFEKNINEIQNYIPQLENCLQDLKNFDKNIEELNSWIKDKEGLFERKIEEPSKTSSNLTDSQRQIGEQLKLDIENQGRGINELLEKAQTAGNRKINPLLKRIEDLKKKLKRLLDRRDEEIDAVDFDYVDKQTIACQNSGNRDMSETIATQTPPEKFTISTSTEPRMKKTKTQTHKPRYIAPAPRDCYFGLRNSGGNRGISKMLYPYCCTTDLLNQKLNLDFVHRSNLNNMSSSTPRQNRKEVRSARVGMSNMRNGSEESIRRNWISQDLI